MWLSHGTGRTGSGGWEVSFPQLLIGKKAGTENYTELQKYTNIQNIQNYLYNFFIQIRILKTCARSDFPKVPTLVCLKGISLQVGGKDQKEVFPRQLSLGDHSCVL